MSIKINFFRSLSLDDVKKLNFQFDYKFYYIANGERCYLKSIEDAQYVCIESEDGEWNCDNYGLGIECALSYQNMLGLYAKNSIAYNDSSMGIACLWNSTESKKKGVVGIREVLHQNEIQNIYFEKYFSSGTYFGSIELEFAIVLLKASTCSDEPAINNTEGVQLGLLGSSLIRLDGSGSIFPIMNVIDKKGHLWNVIMEYGDPSQDLFCSAVRIELNTAHKDYKFIDLKDKNNCCHRLINEIICNSIIQLFLKLKLDNSLDNIETQDCADGSILQVVKYLKETKGFKTDSVESIRASISDYFETKGV